MFGWLGVVDVSYFRKEVTHGIIKYVISVHIFIQ
jgi:hypothetical protein